MLKNLTNALTSNIARKGLIIQKHSPALLFGAGVVGVIATAVLASRATLKLEEVLDETQDKLIVAKGVREDEPEKYSDQDYKRDQVLIYTKAAFSIAKLYGPAIVVGTLTVAALTGSHVVLTRRNAALTAAYAAIEKGFKEYRKRVVDEFGEEKDREFRYGKAVDTNLPIDRPDGTTDEQKVKVLGSKDASIYARFFDESNPNWQRQQSYNQMFINCQQNTANDLLNARGHVFLNEVYDMLGMERSKEGAIVGWVKENGDNFIDFGVFRNGVYMGQEFANGNTRSVLLDFNVDGVIYDKI